MSDPIPSIMNEIETACIAKGLRMTGQRRTIARVIADAGDHPDVEELHRRAAALDSRISLATVYRTVRLFKDMGILESHAFHGRARYEKAPAQHHDHLIDLASGRVIEFRNEEIERLQEIVARQLGYRLVGHRLELYGRPLSAAARARRK
ncbi:MAG TPA: Fur family transcriptional regulator [Aestuariivirgaceae bacterium]